MIYLISIAFFVLGSILASFMAVIAERLYTGQSWVSGRSRCNSCAETLTARDLVPIASWVASFGKCRTCGSRVPAAYALGEATLGALFALSYLTSGLHAALPVFLAVLTTLTFIVMYDLRHTIVPPVASTLLIILSFAYAALVSFDLRHLGSTLLVAGVIGFGFFLLYFLSRGRAMGLGDAPVALALSLVTGSAFAMAGLLFSFWIGAVIGILILLTRKGGARMGIEVPFVPFLAAGYLLAYFTHWNPLFFTWYL